MDTPNLLCVLIVAMGNMGFYLMHNLYLLQCLTLLVFQEERPLALARAGAVNVNPMEKISMPIILMSGWVLQQRGLSHHL